MVDQISVKAVKEKVIVELWSRLNKTVNEKYRLTQAWGRRSEIADFYCKGKGIEIGASAYPVKINDKRTRISYVDCIDRNISTDLKTQKDLPYVHVDIIDEMEELAHIKNNSLDFIIHCHVLEHCRNPIGVIRTHLSKLKKNGVLFMAVPNKTSIFDKNRPLTKWEHFERDDEGIGGAEDEREHFREYLQMAVRFHGNIENEIDRLMQDNYRPHYHVWDFESFYHFLLRTNERLGNGFVIEHYSENRQHRKTPHETREMIAVLRKK